MKQKAVWTLIRLVAVLGIVLVVGCKSAPTVSSLEESELALPSTPVAPMPTGDVYADEELVRGDLPLMVGDVLTVQLKQGDTEETLTRTVNSKGELQVNFRKVLVEGLTVDEAEDRIVKMLAAYYKKLSVQLTVVTKKAKVKRVFVFGDVKKPGVLPMQRHMTVLNVLAESQYEETAKLDNIKIVRYQGGERVILTADLARTFTYADWSQNLSLEENDIVYLPRTGLGDANAFGKVVGPLIWLYTSPVYNAIIIKNLIQ